MPSKPTRAWLVRLAGAALVLAYFFRFVAPGLRQGFASDDPMNIYYYWSNGPGGLARNLVLFFTDYVRPMGGLYYLPLYSVFKLNPLPYHVVAFCLLLFNTWLAFRFAVLLTESELAGGLCAFLVAYHAALYHMVYLPSFIYDILCFTFYFLAFNYYLSVRGRGARLKIWQVAVFLLLYIGALESKEMAVTLPAILLLYEALWHAPGRWSWRSARSWVVTDALPPLAAGALTLVYILGKALGPESLMKLDAYRPVFSLHQYFEATARFLNQLFYDTSAHGFFNARTVLLMAALLLAIAWRTCQKHLFLMFFFVFIAPLPITFIPNRGGPCLYIPLAGWAVFAASALQLLSQAIAKSRLLRRVPIAVTQAAFMLCAVAAQWSLSLYHTNGIPALMKDRGQLTASVIRQIRSLQPTVQPGAAIYVMNDVFDGYDTQFLFELTYGDRSVHVLLDRYTHLSPAQIERMDYVFAFENGILKRLKGAGAMIRSNRTP
ncbi:MAG: hypothetical protein ACLQGV_12140 [Bryobacteraceae bacterium]